MAVAAVSDHLLAGGLIAATLVIALVAGLSLRANRSYLAQAAEAVAAMKGQSEATAEVVGSVVALAGEIENLYSSMFRPYVTLTLEKVRVGNVPLLALTIANRGTAGAEDITFNVASDGFRHNEVLQWMGFALVEPADKYGLDGLPRKSVLQRGVAFLAPGQLLRYPFKKDPTYVHEPYDLEVRYFGSYSPDGTRREYNTSLRMDPEELYDVQVTDLPDGE